MLGRAEADWCFTYRTNRFYKGFRFEYGAADVALVATGIFSALGTFAIPVRAERRCSIVETEAAPDEIVVLLAVLVTFSAKASTYASSPISVLLKRIPVSAGAGFTTILATLPV